MADGGVSVIVPCYNEADGIGPVVAEIRAALAALERPAEVIVVDDGSTDATADRAAAAGCRLVRHETNRGYGAALKTGAREARHAILVITDGDGTYPNREIPRLVAQLEAGEDGARVDMVVGARTGAGAKIPFLRRPAKWALGRLANYLAGLRIPDLNSGLRVIRRELWTKYERFYPDGFSLTTTITLAALTNGHRVCYTAIDYHARVGRSKIRPVRDTLGFLQLILRTILYFDPMKVFLPGALSLLAASVLVGGSTLILSNVFGIGRFLDTTTSLLFVSALQLLAIGVLADLITKRLP
ncbi:MAG: glycosyltransferase family 2 protein [bacterium]|nr:glycosyltransferase family 2 protein [bacterium]